MSKAFKTEKHGYKIADVDAFIKESNQEADAAKKRIAELKRELEEKDTQVKSFKQKQDLIVKSIMGAVQKAEQIEALIKQKYASEMAHLAAFHDRWMGYYDKLIQTYPLSSELTGLNQFNRKMSEILSSDVQPEVKFNEAASQFEREKDRLKKKYIGFIPVEDESDSASDTDILGLSEEEFNPEESIRSMLRRQAAEEERRQAKQAAKGKAAPAKGSKDTKNSKDKTTQQKSTIAAAKTKNAGYNRPPVPQPNPSQMGETDSGFSFEEALNPTQALSDILKEIGLEFGND